MSASRRGNTRCAVFPLPLPLVHPRAVIQNTPASAPEGALFATSSRMRAGEYERRGTPPARPHVNVFGGPTSPAFCALRTRGSSRAVRGSGNFVGSRRALCGRSACAYAKRWRKGPRAHEKPAREEELTCPIDVAELDVASTRGHSCGQSRRNSRERRVRPAADGDPPMAKIGDGGVQIERRIRAIGEMHPVPPRANRPALGPPPLRQPSERIEVLAPNKDHLPSRSEISAAWSLSPRVSSAASV